MRRKFTLLIVIILTSYSMYGQICGTTSTGTVSYSRKTAINTSFLNSSNSININVFFHIVRNTNGTNAFTPPDLGAIISNLNTSYSSHNITFRNAGSEFIDNTNFININGKKPEAMRLGQVNNRSNAINYYIVETLWSTLRGTVLGVANGIISNSLVIRNDRVSTFISPHEIGHCFNLLHTFQGTAVNTDGCAEYIISSSPNCDDCGDEVCDTPADANTRNEGGYNPDLTNIMSYYDNLDHITNGQAERIRIAFASSLLLQKVVVPELSSINNLCFSNNKILTISNINNNTTTWQASSNVSILSRNNTSITVRASSSSATGNGWVKATLSNGLVLKEEFKVGVPYGYTNKIILVNREYSLRHASYLYLRNWTRVYISDYEGYFPAEGSNWEWSVPNSRVGENFGGSNINVEPLSLGNITIKARRKNKCGYGPWISKVFNVIERPSGSGYTLEDIN